MYILSIIFVAHTKPSSKDKSHNFFEGGIPEVRYVLCIIMRLQVCVCVCVCVRV